MLHLLIFSLSCILWVTSQNIEASWEKEDIWSWDANYKDWLSINFHTVKCNRRVELGHIRECIHYENCRKPTTLCPTFRYISDTCIVINCGLVERPPLRNISDTFEAHWKLEERWYEAINRSDLWLSKSGELVQCKEYVTHIFPCAFYEQCGKPRSICDTYYNHYSSQSNIKHSCTAFDCKAYKKIPLDFGSEIINVKSSNISIFSIWFKMDGNVWINEDGVKVTCSFHKDVQYVPHSRCKIYKRDCKFPTLLCDYYEAATRKCHNLTCEIEKFKVETKILNKKVAPNVSETVPCKKRISNLVQELEKLLHLNQMDILPQLKIIIDQFKESGEIEMTRGNATTKIVTNQLPTVQTTVTVTEKETTRFVNNNLDVTDGQSGATTKVIVTTDGTTTPDHLTTKIVTNQLNTVVTGNETTRFVTHNVNVTTDGQSGTTTKVTTDGTTTPDRLTTKIVTNQLNTVVTGNETTRFVTHNVNVTDGQDAVITKVVTNQLPVTKKETTRFDNNDVDVTDGQSGATTDGQSGATTDDQSGATTDGTTTS
jgi:hypothetical protein